MTTAVRRGLVRMVTLAKAFAEEAAGAAVEGKRPGRGLYWAHGITYREWQDFQRAIQWAEVYASPTAKRSGPGGLAGTQRSKATCAKNSS